MTIKSIVIGLGNPILTDDGAGFHVAKQLKNIINNQQVTITEESISGLNILELLFNYDKAIIVDAIQTAGGTAGYIHRLRPESFNFTIHSSSPHDINLATALELGRKLKLPIPQDVIIYAIEVVDIQTFSEICTTAVQQGINQCVNMVIQELQNSGYIRTDLGK